MAVEKSKGGLDRVLVLEVARVTEVASRPLNGSTRTNTTIPQQNSSASHRHSRSA